MIASVTPKKTLVIPTLDHLPPPTHWLWLQEFEELQRLWSETAEELGAWVHSQLTIDKQDTHPENTAAYLWRLSWAFDRFQFHRMRVLEAAENERRRAVARREAAQAARWAAMKPPAHLRGL